MSSSMDPSVGGSSQRSSLQSQILHRNSTYIPKKPNAKEGRLPSVTHAIAMARGVVWKYQRPMEESKEFYQLPSSRSSRHEEMTSASSSKEDLKVYCKQETSAFLEELQKSSIRFDLKMRISCSSLSKSLFQNFALPEGFSEEEIDKVFIKPLLSNLEQVYEQMKIQSADTKELDEKIVLLSETLFQGYCYWVLQDEENQVGSILKKEYLSLTRRYLSESLQELIDHIHGYIQDTFSKYYNLEREERSLKTFLAKVIEE